MGKPRNSDGTIRRANRPKQVTNRSLVARWVEAESLRLKVMGMGYLAIADHIVRVARGGEKPMVPLPEGTVLPPDYRISMQAVHRACRRATLRLPNTEAAESRKVDTERLEGLLLALQPGIRNGDPRSVEVAVKVLMHMAELNGYIVQTKISGGGAQVNVLIEQQAAQAQADAELDRLTIPELREYRRLEAKARGLPEAIEGSAVKVTDPNDSGTEAADSAPVKRKDDGSQD